MNTFKPFQLAKKLSFFTHFLSFFSFQSDALQLKKVLNWAKNA